MRDVSRMAARSALADGALFELFWCAVDQAGRANPAAAQESITSTFHFRKVSLDLEESKITREISPIQSSGPEQTQNLCATE